MDLKLQQEHDASDGADEQTPSRLNGNFGVLKAIIAADPRVEQIAQKVTLKKLVLIYKSWELVYAAEV